MAGMFKGGPCNSATRLEFQAVIIFVQRYNMDQYGTMINPGIKWVDHLFSQLKHFKGSSYGPSK